MTARSLRAWRLRLGLTQPQMAAALGISRSTWIRYEHGPAPAWVYLAMYLPFHVLRDRITPRPTDESEADTTT